MMYYSLQEFKDLRIKPIKISLYHPPMVWKGDPIGHMGLNDLFFFVMEGECYLNIDSQSYIVRPGQLAFLPKGKMRTYTHVSENFSMYELSFSAEDNGISLMELLGLTQGDFVVDIADKNELNTLFENSSYVESFNPIYVMKHYANLMNIIAIYTQARQKLTKKKARSFQPVLDYMEKNISSSDVNVEKLSGLMYMQPTYFIQKFHSCFGLSPMAYFTRMRVYKAMSLLLGTSLSLEEISHQIGITDVSYFSRVFKKHCKITPTQYKEAFRRQQ